MDFIQDTQQMAMLFEEFVRNFYRLHAAEFKVTREDIHWRWIAADKVPPGCCPRCRRTSA